MAVLHPLEFVWAPKVPMLTTTSNDSSAEYISYGTLDEFRIRLSGGTADALRPKARRHAVARESLYSLLD